MQTNSLKISGMMCEACVSHVTQALQSVPGVQSARVDLAAATARVEGQGFDAAALLAAVEEEGYQAAPLAV